MLIGILNTNKIKIFIFITDKQYKRKSILVVKISS